MHELTTVRKVFRDKTAMADGGGLSVNYARSGDVIPGMCALPAELRDAQV